MHCAANQKAQPRNSRLKEIYAFVLPDNIKILHQNVNELLIIKALKQELNQLSVMYPCCIVI